MFNRPNFLDLSDKVACVTGVESGLGQRTAIVLASAGAKVVGVTQDEAALDQLEGSVGSNLAGVVADVSDRNRIAQITGNVSIPFGSPDIIVHAAGIHASEFGGADMAAKWDHSMDAGLSMPFFISQAIVPAMKEKGWGRIVNFVPMAVPSDGSFRFAEKAMTGGVGQLTRAMAEAWSSFGIMANAIAPASFSSHQSGIANGGNRHSEPDSTLTCSARNGRLSDIEGPILFLCSDASRYVTGQILAVDGGISAK